MYEILNRKKKKEQEEEIKARKNKIGKKNWN